MTSTQARTMLVQLSKQVDEQIVSITGQITVDELPRLIACVLNLDDSDSCADFEHTTITVEPAVILSCSQLLRKFQAAINSERDNN